MTSVSVPWLKSRHINLFWREMLNNAMQVCANYRGNEETGFFSAGNVLFRQHFISWDKSCTSSSARLHAPVYWLLLLQWAEYYLSYQYNWSYPQVETHQRKYLTLWLKGLRNAMTVSTNVKTMSSSTRMSLRYPPRGLLSRQQLTSPCRPPLLDGRGQYFTRS